LCEGRIAVYDNGKVSMRVYFLFNDLLLLAKGDDDVPSASGSNASTPVRRAIVGNMLGDASPQRSPSRTINNSDASRVRESESPQSRALSASAEHSFATPPIAIAEAGSLSASSSSSSSALSTRNKKRLSNNDVFRRRGNSDNVPADAAPLTISSPSSTRSSTPPPTMTGSDRSARASTPPRTADDVDAMMRVEVSAVRVA
jgi:hypothetical protein